MRHSHTYFCTFLSYSNGTLFEKHHLRVDSAESDAKFDPKRSVFVGNVPFGMFSACVRRCQMLSHVTLRCERGRALHVLQGLWRGQGSACCARQGKHGFWRKLPFPTSVKLSFRCFFPIDDRCFRKPQSVLASPMCCLRHAIKRSSHWDSAGRNCDTAFVVRHRYRERLMK